jgi:hypothetical protein
MSLLRVLLGVVALTLLFARPLSGLRICSAESDFPTAVPHGDCL